MNRRGFSLVEVMVAVTLAGLSLALAAAVFAATNDSVRTVSIRSTEWKREANAVRWLAAAVTGVTVSNEALFDGSSERMTFHTSEWVRDGWTEPTIFEAWFTSGELVARTESKSRVVLADSLRTGAFDYLTAYGAGSLWLTRWASNLTPPLAIRLRLLRRDLTADTLLFFIGDRS